MTNVLKCAFRSAIVLALLVAVPASVDAQAVSRMFVFGDSLSDTGNDLIATSLMPVKFPPPQTYAAGRFSNGPVAFEYLWSSLSGGPAFIAPSLAVPTLPPVGAVSFAYGGSGSGLFKPFGALQIPGLLTQVQLFQAALHGQAAPADALYAVWTGSNDYSSTPGASLQPETVVDNIATGVALLYYLGARNILVVNLPDLGDSPLVRPGSPESQALSALSTEHNKLLRKVMRQLEKLLPGLTVIDGDVTKVRKSIEKTLETDIPLLDVLVPVPAGSPPTSVCILINPATCPAVPSFEPDAPFFFWDAEHPTTVAHERVAEEFVQPVLKALRHPVAH
jgi:phospholipase/lecithinase/hemolysin